MQPRIVFMGSPEFSCPTLIALVNSYSVVGVITQPDRPAGRGNIITPPPVKVIATELGIPIFQPERLKHPSSFDQLQEWNPDLIVVAAYGQILRQNILDFPALGCINVHGSLLPRWRGAAPIQYAILNGDRETGITIMKMDAGVDTGPIFNQASLSIFEKETTEELSLRLSILGSELIISSLQDYISGKITPNPQPEIGITYSPMMKKEDGKIDFNQSIVEIDRKVRAFTPWPGTFVKWQEQVLKILKIHSVKHLPEIIDIGCTTIWDGLPAICAPDGMIVLDMVQPAGKKPMPGKSFLQGARDWKNGIPIE